MQDPERKQGRLDRFGNNVNIFDSIKAAMSGTPTGGGILVVLVVLVLFSAFHYFGLYEIDSDRFILILLAFVLFGFVGFLDDIHKVFKFKGLALRVRHKLLIQLAVGGIVAWWGVSRGLISIEIPFLNFELTNFWVLVSLSAMVLIFMSNAFNILDGIDGLSSGSLLITLLPLILFLNHAGIFGDVLFSWILFGATLAYLYFNIHPARLIMGDTGAIAFGAMIGLFALTSGTLYLLPIYGLIYIVDAGSSLLQWASLYFRNGKKIFKIAPVHHHFEAIGWDGPKVVFRFWVLHAFFSLLAVGVFYLVV